MHEYSIVEQMIQSLSKEFQREGIEQVKEIRLRRNSIFSAGALEQAFEMLSPNTPLQGAALIVEDVVFEHECKNCGRKAVITHDDLVGHHIICENCGASEYIDESGGLELLEVIT